MDFARVVRDLVALVMDEGDPREWDARVVARVDELLTGASPRSLVAIEANRARFFGHTAATGRGWDRFELVFVDGLALPVRRLLTFHGNGRVREAAVASLASSSDAGDLPFLLLRANDWVLQVSARARSALENRLNLANASAWVEALPFEARTRSLQRRDLAYLFDEARRLLTEPEARPLLEHALRASSREVRRAVVSLLVGLALEERADLLTIALADRDPIVTREAAKLLFVDAPDDEVIASLLRHRVALVRAGALTEAWKRRIPRVSELTRELLIDPAAWVREVAVRASPPR